jgi:hypothetical protein
MNQNYKNNIPYSSQGRKDPLRAEIERNIGKINLEITIEEDKDSINLLKHITGPIIAYKATVRKNSLVIGVGRGSSILTRLNKYYDRSIRYSWNASLIDGIIQSVKSLDALYLTQTNQKETESSEVKDVEDQDFQASYTEDLPQTATIKQINFLKKLVEHCEDSEKEEYLSALASPYLSKFDCSELIKRLMPVK